MSLVDVRNAFIVAAGKHLNLDSLVFTYTEDRSAQQLTVSGTLENGTGFIATTAPFIGAVPEIMKRAERLAAEIIAPDARERGTQIKFAVDESTRDADAKSVAKEKSAKVEHTKARR